MANGILNTQVKQSKLGLKGLTPPTVAAQPTSTLHYQSSLNNSPAINRSPSNLDLDGKTPDQYINNLPQ